MPFEPAIERDLGVSHLSGLPAREVKKQPSRTDQIMGSFTVRIGFSRVG